MFGMQKMCEQKLSKEEINKYKRAFAIFDSEGDGTITTEVIRITILLKSTKNQEVNIYSTFLNFPFDYELLFFRNCPTS